VQSAGHGPQGIGRDPPQMTCYSRPIPREKNMLRRNLLQFACAIMPALPAMPVSLVASRANAATPDIAKVVYGLSDLEKVEFAFGNINNHYKGMGGPEHVTIALVVNGPALKAFHFANATPEVTQRTAEMVKMGLELDACINSMRAQEVTLKDLLPGFIIAEKGGVVRVAELQSQGYCYIRP
jgi:uncharacterized protein